MRSVAARMHRARPLESDPHSADDRGAADAASRSSPLEVVSAAVAGEDLHGLASTASDALGRPVAVVIPALGEPLAAPGGSIADPDVREIVRYAAALIADEETEPPAVIADAVPVRIGQQIIGIAAATGVEEALSGADAAAIRAWLEATAAASAITALMRSAEEGGLEGSRRALLQALGAGPPANVDAFVSHARRLGFDLSAGAVAICARPSRGNGSAELPTGNQALVADLANGRIYGLVPLASTLAVDGSLQALVSEFAEAGMEVALSSPRRDPAALHHALREAELLLELGCPPVGQDQTYRLLVGILFRDPAELEQLRSQTISPLVAYDSEHDTELLTTLQEFLLHHGSTTETAESMHLHRHTVGYRLARVHEVSGLSPYESEGRERLSLGLKAHQLLAADERLSNPG